MGLKELWVIIKDKRSVSFEEEWGATEESLKGTDKLEEHVAWGGGEVRKTKKMYVLRWGIFSRKGEDPISEKFQMSGPDKEM